MLLPGRVHGQDDSAFRIGLSAGGVSTISLVLEKRMEWGSFELMLGTWSFRDLSVSLVHKQYIGGGDVQGIAGVGLWSVLAFPPDENVGIAWVARAPIGVEWQVSGEHYLAMEVGFNRAFFIRRTDPDDDTPPNNRIVPLPGASYRWASR